VEIALAMVLLAGAGLLIRTFRDLRSVNPGFATRNIITMDMSLAGARFTKTSAVAELVREGQQRLESLPGVEVAAATCCLPLDGGYGMSFNIEGRAATEAPHAGSAAWRTISPDYFRAFRIPLLRGRAFTVNDSGSSQPVIIINEAMAKQYWPKGGELGSWITLGTDLGPQWAEPPAEIVGVVGDVRDRALNFLPIPTMYEPEAQVTDRINAASNVVKPLAWIIRTRIAPLSLNHEIQQQLRIASGGLPVGHVQTMRQVVAQSTQQDAFNMTLLVSFAALALLLAAVGIYGVLAYSVQQRTQEIGIRVALGAQRREILGLVLGHGAKLTLIGVAIGIAAAFGLTRFLTSQIYGIKATDPVTFIGVAILLTLVALLACYIPARRAMRVDPMVALRHE
jgi:putative ABC transport system permease protein